MICWCPRRSPWARALSAATSSPLRIRAPSMPGTRAVIRAIPWSVRRTVTCRSRFAAWWRAAAPAGSRAWRILAASSPHCCGPHPSSSASREVRIASTCRRCSGVAGPRTEPTLWADCGSMRAEESAEIIPGMLRTSRREVASVRPATAREDFSARDASARATSAACLGLSSRRRQSAFTASSRCTAVRARSDSSAPSRPTMVSRSVIVPSMSSESRGAEPRAPSSARTSRAARRSSSPMVSCSASTWIGRSARGGSPPAGSPDGRMCSPDGRPCSPDGRP